MVKKRRGRRGGADPFGEPPSPKPSKPPPKRKRPKPIGSDPLDPAWDLLAPDIRRPVKYRPMAEVRNTGNAIQNTMEGVTDRPAPSRPADLPADRTVNVVRPVRQPFGPYEIQYNKRGWERLHMAYLREVPRLPNWWRADNPNLCDDRVREIVYALSHAGRNAYLGPHRIWLSRTEWENAESRPRYFRIGEDGREHYYEPEDGEEGAGFSDALATVGKAFSSGAKSIGSVLSKATSAVSKGLSKIPTHLKGVAKKVGSHIKNPSTFINKEINKVAKNQYESLARRVWPKNYKGPYDALKAQLKVGEKWDNPQQVLKYSDAWEKLQAIKKRAEEAARLGVDPETLPLKVKKGLF